MSKDLNIIFPFEFKSALQIFDPSKCYLPARSSQGDQTALTTVENV